MPTDGDRPLQRMGRSDAADAATRAREARRQREARQQSVNAVRAMPRGDGWIGDPQYTQSEQGVRTLSPGEAPKLFGEYDVGDPYDAMEEIATQVAQLTDAVGTLLKTNGVDVNVLTSVTAEAPATDQVAGQNEAPGVEAPPIAPAEQSTTSPALIDFAARLLERDSALAGNAAEPTAAPVPQADFDSTPASEAATG